MGFLVGIAGAAVVACFALVGFGVPYAGWLALLVTMAWMVLSLSLAAMNLAVDAAGTGVSPSLWTIFRTWLLTAARMVWFPFALAMDGVRKRRPAE